MRYLSVKRTRFLSTVKNYRPLYSYSNPKNQIVISSGVMNFIWNAWNSFWRDYWLAHISGGYNFNNTLLAPIYNNYNDKQSCHYMLYACNYAKRHVAGNAIVGGYQEKTWGDPRNIISLASELSMYHLHMNYILSLLGTYQTQIEHFQKIRNSLIHLNNENITNLNTIRGYYIFNSNQGLIDILDTVDIHTNVRCFDNLVNSMEGMILNL